MTVANVRTTTRFRFRGSSITRRGLIGAAAGLVAARPARAQEAEWSDPAAPPIRAGRWVEASEVGVARFQAVDGVAPEPIAFAAPFAFTGVAPHWSGKERPGATVEVSLSPDGAAWTDPIVVGEDADAGRPGRDQRRYGPLIATTPAAWVRYRTFDADGNPAALRGLAWEYIDAAGDPAAAEAAQQATPVPAEGFAVLSRAEWGADESLRFDNGWEIWPPEYAPVSHAIVHHSDTANYEDPLAAIRSIYYYHAVTRGWGDIGYNFLVDFLGNVYEGRFGGENVAGGHALGYNEGTCGICLMGRFAGEEPTPEMLRGLAAILARVTAGLDPFGEAPLRDIAGLPTIAAHRDVNPTACPGDVLYADLGALREEVVAVREGALAAVPPPRFLAGDAAATTEEGVALREGPGLDFGAITTLALGEPLTVADGPATNDGLIWYQVQGSSLAGWVAEDYLTAITPLDDPDAAVGGLSDGGASSAHLAGWSAGTVVAVVEGDLLLRDAPGGDVLRTLPEGAWLEVIGPPEPAWGTLWYPVDTGLGVTGWVSGDYLRLA